MKRWIVCCCLCIRCARTGNRGPASWPLTRTRRYSTCPTLPGTNKLDVHTSRLSQGPLLSFNFGSRAHDPSLNISDQDRVFLYGKEHIAKAAAYAGGTGLNGAILRILKKARPHAQVTFIALPWIKVAPRRVSARRFKGTWRQGQLPSGQTAKARSDHRVQSLRMGHGRHRFLRIQLRC
jgi:hypothetical protein